MRCGTARAFVQESLDGPLSPPDEAMVEAHLASCDSCRHYRQSLQRSVGLLAGLDRQAAPLDFGATVSFQLRRESSGRRWGFPVAVAASVVAGIMLTVPNLHSGDLSSGQRAQALQAQLAADQAQAEFMHWMDPSADGGSGLAVEQAAFEAAPETYPGQPEPVQSGR